MRVLLVEDEPTLARSIELMLRSETFDNGVLHLVYGPVETAPDGTYEVVFEACIGCSICEEVCPVEACITMVNELEFDNNDSHYELSKADPEGYKQLLLSHGVPVGNGKAAEAVAVGEEVE